MIRFRLELENFKRKSAFPFQLKSIFYSRDLILPPERQTVCPNQFEVCLRLASETNCCEDIINGRQIHAAYPHAVWKMPLAPTHIRDSKGRDVLALIYAPQSAELFRQFGMIPPEECLQFSMTSELQLLKEKFFFLTNNIYSPGAADQLDWVGFCLIKEVLLAGQFPAKEQSTGQMIKNLSLQLKIHSSEEHDFHRLAQNSNMSYTRFYREWNKYIGIPPQQFIINARLENAAELLTQTDMSIAKIVERINFSGTYAFYRKFTQKYGMTPGEFRETARQSGENF